MKKRKKVSGFSGLVLALIAVSVFGGYKYILSLSPRQLVREPSGSKVAVEELSFHLGKDKLYGTVYKPADTLSKRPLVIYCHDLGQTGAEWADLCRRAVGCGYVAYAFDFRGGSPASRSTGSMGDMSVQTQKDDLETVIRRLRGERYVDGKQIVLVGHGQGGLVASEAAVEKHNGIGALVLLSPAYNLAAEAQARYPRLGDIPDTTLIQGAYSVGRHYFSDIRSLNPYRWMHKFKGDVLILHGTADDRVPLSASQAATGRFPSLELEVLEGAGHDFSGAARKSAAERIVRFLDEHFPTTKDHE